MSKILIDGESLFQASNVIEAISAHATPHNNNTLSVYDALTNVIYSIILWDDTYVMEETFNSHYLEGVKYFEQYEVKFHILRRPHLSAEIQKSQLDHFFEFQEGEASNTIDDLKPDENGMYDSLSVMKALFGSRPSYRISHQGKRALDYLLIANEQGLSYMPSVDRQLILESYDFMSFFNRSDVIAKVDKELIDYYNRVNSHLPKPRIKYKFPVILDYLMDRYKSIEDIIKSAFELKYESATIRFRREMDALEDEFKSGNVRHVEDYFINIERILSDLTDKHGIEKKIDVTLGLPPSLSFSIEGADSKPFQSVFLKDLSYYGITKRIPRPPLDGVLYFRM